MMSPRQIAKAMGLFGAAALLIVVVVGVLVVRHRSSGQNTPQLAIVPNTLLNLKNFRWTQMKSDQIQWHLTAKEASYSNDKTSILLSDPNLSMVSEDGKKVVVTAPAATIAVSGNHVNSAHLKGGLQIKYGDFVITTDEATFLPDNDAVTAPGKVMIVGQGLTATGVGLAGRPKERIFTLLSRTNTEISPKSVDARKPKKS